MENNNQSMNTVVETFYVSETINLIHDNEALSKWNEKVEELKLTGQKEVVKELIQDEYSLENTKKELEKLLFDNKFRDNQLMQYTGIIETLGKSRASANASLEILKL